MSKTIVVAIDLSKEEESMSFKKLPFEEQLSLIGEKIDKVCGELSKMEADNWIISWQEYGLSNHLGEHGDRCLSLKQRKDFKEFLRTLSQKHLKLTLIGGTIASAREIDVETQQKKASKVKKFENPAFFEGKPKLFTIRNTAYVANKGRVTRHDKTQNYFEISNFKPPGLGVFRPGTGNKGEKSKIDETIGIEICTEHASGVLASEVSGKNPPCIQFILSDSTSIRPKYRISPYLIHIDSKKEIRMITEASEAHTEVELYSYDVWSEISKLTEIKPIPMRSYIFSIVLEIFIKEADENPMRSVTRYITEECQLNSHDCSELIGFISEKWVQNQCAPLPFHRVKQVIEMLLSLPSASNLSLDRETSKNLIDSALAANKRYPDQSFINRIKAIPLREVLETKRETVASDPKSS